MDLSLFTFYFGNAVYCRIKHNYSFPHIRHHSRYHKTNRASHRSSICFGFFHCYSCFNYSCSFFMATPSMGFCHGGYYAGKGFYIRVGIMRGYCLARLLGYLRQVGPYNADVCCIGYWWHIRLLVVIEKF